ncbi:MAG: hypothetical protein RML92_08780 [Bacteroidia bacterium]|nr:hypothetical protein [Bacteroidia bacterium]
MFRSSLSSRVCIAVLTFSFGPSASLLGQGSIIYRQIPYQEFQQIVGEPWRPKYGNIPGLTKKPILELTKDECWKYGVPYAYTFPVFGTPVTIEDYIFFEYVVRYKPYGSAQTAAGPLPVFIRIGTKCNSEDFSEKWMIYPNKSEPDEEVDIPRSFFPTEPPISPKGLILAIDDRGRRVGVADITTLKVWEGVQDFRDYLGRIGALRKVQGEAAGDFQYEMPFVRQIYDVKGRSNACILELVHEEDSSRGQNRPYYILLEWF